MRSTKAKMLMTALAGLLTGMLVTMLIISVSSPAMHNIEIPKPDLKEQCVQKKASTTLTIQPSLPNRELTTELVKETPVETTPANIIIPPNKWCWPNELRFESSDIKTLTFTNADEEDLLISISYSEPHFLEEGYTNPPSEAINWVSLGKEEVLLKPNERESILIKLTIPEGMSLPDRWQFWVIVRPNNNIYPISGSESYIICQSAVKCYVDIN